MTRRTLVVPNTDYDPCLKTGRFEDLFPENAVCFRVLRRWQQVTILEWWGGDGNL